MINCYTSIFKHSIMDRNIMVYKMFLPAAFKNEFLKKF